MAGGAPGDAALMNVTAIIAAGGAGRRMGAARPKQYLPLGDLPVIVHVLKTFSRVSAVTEILLVVPRADVPRVRSEIVGRYGLDKVHRVIAGGRERQDSVARGLAAVRADATDIVVIHDAVRPLATPALVEAAIDGAVRWGAVATGIPVRDTVKSTDAEGWAEETLPRERLRLVQTPQAFRLEVIRRAHERAAAEGFYGTDDAALVERTGTRVRMIPGLAQNIKMTTPEDLDWARWFLEKRGRESGEGATGLPERVGWGYDSHRLVSGRRLILGGVDIPHPRGLLGHSDGDALIHAVIDALLGAVGGGDIGRLFPDSDPAYRGVSSLTLLAQVGRLVKENKFEAVHLDATILMEKPKLAPHIPAMIEHLSKTLRLDAGRVSIKAKTNEGMGFVGREEGVAVFAVATVRECGR